MRAYRAFNPLVAEQGAADQISETPFHPKIYLTNDTAILANVL